ncbi:MAG: polyprenyl synthetase family protein [Prevotellaceae bacterium]|nr:polyprenyl synthetase family protein [Prevotellaceae bacterium]MDY2749666.1 polyprenyl synthetase family protein [Prevotella sp.]
MKDYVSIIKQPIEQQLQVFDTMFAEVLSHSDGQLSMALDYIRRRAGKRMRPILILLIARSFGEVTETTYRAALGLELLHTASLVHDDIVDEAEERRGQASVNAVYGNKVAVLVGDYILSTALLNVAQTGSNAIVEYLGRLGQTLSNGEILQLTSNGSENISEDAYYEVIKLKTAALFEACCAMGSLSVNAREDCIAEAKDFGQQLGIIFQIRDDIFDYYDNTAIGKPTGNDMMEGKLTLPVIHALLTVRDDEMLTLARKVKRREATSEDIARLVLFTKQNGGIEYAEKVMAELHRKALTFIEKRVGDSTIKAALEAYLDYVIKREK